MTRKRFLVDATSAAMRKGIHDDYVLVVTPEQRREMRLGRWAVAVRHQSFTRRGQPKEHKFHAICRVVEDATGGDWSSGDTVRADQTLRYCLGLWIGYDKLATAIEIHPLRLTKWQHIREWVAKIMRRQPLCLRVFPGYIVEIEKNMVRIPEETFEILGTDAGATLVLQNATLDANGTYHLREQIVKANAMGAGQGMLGQSKRILTSMADPSDRTLPGNDLPEDWHTLVADPTEMGKDLLPILMDLDARFAMHVNLLQSVRVRRDLGHLVRTEIHEFGVAFLLSLLALGLFLPFGAGHAWLVVLLSVLIAGVMTAIKIRSRLS